MAPDRTDVLYGSLGLMIIKTLEALGPLHGYRIARRIEQISGDQLALNQGTLYPALLKLEQMGWIAAEWGTRDYWQQWRSVRIPALLIEAGNSVTPPGQMREMNETGYRTTYLHVPGAGHLIHDEAPQIYREAVESFLTALAQRA